MTYAAANFGRQYILWGAAGLICLVTFLILILSPALSAHGRIWEKTAAGFLAVFVLAALVLGGVVIGLVFVLYYPEIKEYLHLG